MEMKKGFILYNDTYSAIKELPIKDKALLLDAIFNYANSEPVGKLPTQAKVAFAFIKQSLDRDNKKWENIREKRIYAGRLGGKMRVANQASASKCKQTQANQAVNVNVNVNVNKYTKIENIKEEEIRKISKQYGVTEEFVKNRLEDLKDYCLANGKKYKDYLAALRNFVRKDSSVKKQTFSDIPKGYRLVTKEKIE